MAGVKTDVKADVIETFAKGLATGAIQVGLGGVDWVGMPETRKSSFRADAERLLDNTMAAALDLLAAAAVADDKTTELHPQTRYWQKLRAEGADAVRRIWSGHQTSEPQKPA